MVLAAESEESAVWLNLEPADKCKGKRQEERGRWRVAMMCNFISPIELGFVQDKGLESLMLGFNQMQSYSVLKTWGCHMTPWLHIFIFKIKM